MMNILNNFHEFIGRKCSLVYSGPDMPTGCNGTYQIIGYKVNVYSKKKIEFNVCLVPYGSTEVPSHMLYDLQTQGVNPNYLYLE